MISLGQDWDEVALRWLGPTTGCSAHMEQPWQGVEGWAVAGSATGDTSTLWHGGTGTQNPHLGKGLLSPGRTEGGRGDRAV